MMTTCEQINTMDEIIENLETFPTEDADEEWPEDSVRNVQEAINISHPFGLKLWKPALYHKARSINEKSYQALHSIPGSVPLKALYLSPGNILWTLLFGWWLSLLYLVIASLMLTLTVVGMVCAILLSPLSRIGLSLVPKLFLQLVHMKEYALVLINLSGYIFWPFGKYIAKRKGSHMLFQQSEPSSPQRVDEASVLLSVPTEQGSSRQPHYETMGPQVEEGSSRVFIEPDELHFAETGLPRVPIPRTFLAKWIPRTLQRTWNAGLSGMLSFLIILLILTPIHLLVSGICFFLVFPLPMAKLNFVFVRHLLRHPLQLSAHRSVYHSESENIDQTAFPPETIHPHSTNTHFRPKSVFVFRPDSIVLPDTPTSTPYLGPQVATGDQTVPSIVSPSLRPSDRQEQAVTDEHHIVLCTYHAMGWDYYKYTVDNINIIFINLVAVVFFTLFDFYVIGPINGYTGIAHHGIIFGSALVSVIPLAYFIGMAVSSITAHTGSVAIGSVVNATFGSIIEIILYIFALIDGKTELVEGAIIGSFLCGLLALPGVSMFFGGLVRPEQRFNAKSANITSTLLVMAVIGAFTPTLFQTIYGSVEIHCGTCETRGHPSHHTNPLALIPPSICKTCRMFPTKLSLDPVYQNSTRPLMFLCASVLVLTYAVGLCFTLGTHAHRIYPAGKPFGPRRNSRAPPTPLTPVPSDSHRLYPQYGGLTQRTRSVASNSSRNTPILTGSNPTSSSHRNTPVLTGSNPTSYRNSTHDSSQTFDGLEIRLPPPATSSGRERKKLEPLIIQRDDSATHGSNGSEDEEKVVHESPGWSITKSGFVLLMCTILYSLIAEVLIASLDDVLVFFPMTEKTLGLTLFAIVPTVTEFYNAIAFAMQGNIVLSLEIGSAYAVQIAFLQIPVLVAFSALWKQYGSEATVSTPSSIKPFEFIQQASQVATQAFKSSSTLLKPRWQTSSQSDGFTLVFPKWDFYSVLFAVFLRSVDSE